MGWLAAFLFAISLAFGQSGRDLSPGGATPAETPGARQFLREFGRDEWKIWTSPFRRESYSSGAGMKYVLPFVLLSGTLIATDRHTAHILPNTPDQTRWSGRISQMGASYTLVGLSGATYLLGKATGSKREQEAGWLALKAVAHTQIVVFAVKEITNRQRPIAGGTGIGFWQGGNSFPSGHAATSFAVATVFAYEYRDHIAVPITAYAIAGTVAASRVGARRHWVSDIVVGGTTGFLLGRYVYHRHHDPSLTGKPTSRVVPNVAFAGREVSLEWRF